MKKLYLLLSLMLLLLTVSFTYAQETEKTLVQSLKLDSHQEIALNLPGTIEIQTWENPLMRVQITVVLPNGNEAMLKSLIRAGRYSVTSEVAEDGSMTITAPNLLRKVTVGGKELEERISYLVYAPKDMVVKHAIAGTSSVTGASTINL